jgi:hypothetical protein
MRQLFWGSAGLCLLAGVGGHVLSWELRIPVVGQQNWTRPGEAGTIVLLSVSLFFLALILSAVLRWRPERRRAQLAPLPGAASAAAPRDGAV